MSGRTGSGEIEDILTSIRRLVSEDLRPAPRPKIVSKMVVEDKLILTPALRVVSSRPARLAPADPTEAAAPARPPSAPLPRLHLGAELEIPPATPDVVSTLSQAVDRQTGLDWDSETGDPEPDITSLDWSSFTFARRSMQETWIARTAAVTPMEPAPIKTAPDTSAQGTAEPEAATWHDEIPEATWAEAATPENDLPEYDLPEADADWADEAEAEVIASLQQLEVEAASPAPEDLTGAVQEEDNIFSEQVLRELVRDLIREQLQGDLGERMTRNIRKLVKAEIARAVAVQALE
ncbi:hypothetical protein GC209_11920 [bacterium]|nr:hypothetical protein [bacterium]